ncbi:MAG: hypothetical protein ABWZ66_00150 [Pyrinomonadaceae bacterium]
MKKYFFSGAICVLFLCLPVSAQTTNSTTNQTTDDANAENSDIVITATVRAKELKFEIVPTPTVEFPGTKTRQTVWEADRENLPAQVEPGVVYRDIGIRLRIYSRFSEIQRIVLEALDEPNAPTEDAKSTDNQPTGTVKPPKQ